MEKLSDKKILGILDKNRTQPIPIVPIDKDTYWEGGIHHHFAERAGEHYDLRLGDPKTGFAHSWALRRLPEPGDKALAVQQPTHTVEYMDFKGTIPEGYGKGKVKLAFRDKIEIIKSDKDNVSFNVYKGAGTEKYRLIRTNGNQWLLVNYTATKKSRPDVPSSKPKYKEVEFDEVITNRKDQVMAPKLDGAHNTFLIKPDKSVEVYSYRPTERKTGRIEHTYRTELWKAKGTKNLGDTIVRGELFIPKADSSASGGALNANVWKSRAKQKEIGKLDNVIFDVVRFKGEDVADAPYKEKFKMLEEVNQDIPQLKLPELSWTEKAKNILLSSIGLGTHKQTDEGVVIYSLDKSVPIKAKKKKDYDVFIQDVFEGKGRLQEKDLAGGFVASRTPEGEPIVRIGGGFSDELRSEIKKNPDKFVGKWAKVYALSEFPSGKLRMPIFKEMREYEKY